MRNHFLFVLFLLSTPILTLAQCTPDGAENTRGAYPRTLSGACVNGSYDQTITVVAPIDTLIGGFIVPLDSIKVGILNNLPFGFATSCGSFNCTGYPPNFSEPAKECIRLTGVATSAFPEDTIFIPVTYYVTIFGFAQPIEDDLYVLLETFEPDTSVSVVGTTLISQASSASYQWLDCNNGMTPILNATGPSFTATESGSFAVEVTQRGCIGESSCYTVSGLAVNEYLSGKLINVFPNPTEGLLHVDIRDINKTVDVRVFSAVGKLIYEGILEPNTLQTLQLEGLNGVYLIEFTTSNGDRARQTVLLQH